MTSSEDILSAYPPFDRSQVTDYSFSGGIFSLRTTGSDPWFKVIMKAASGSVLESTAKFGQVHPINPSQFKQLRIRMSVSTASFLQVIWENAAGLVGGSDLVPTTPGWQTYTVNLDVSNWNSGEKQSLRIDPTFLAGENVQIDFIHLIPAGCTNPELRVATFRQPDREGGADFFASTRQNPLNFNSTADIASIGGHSSAAIYPSNTYQDSAGATRQNDFFEATNNAGNGDAFVHLLFPGRGVRVDANRYKIACWTFDVLRPPTEFHSVARVLWNVDGVNQGTDDFVTINNGEARYCARMDTVALEPALQPGQTHPWRNNSDGSGIDFLRFDGHEEETPTGYRLSDFRLAADHEADKRFAIVMRGERQSPIEISYRLGNGGPVALTTLPANRNSDVFIWNTEALPPGTYTLQSKVGLTSFDAPGPVVVSRSGDASDSSAPALQVDVPANGHSFDGSLQVVGYAVDNRKVAAVEVTIDGSLVDSFSPTNFDARARDSQPSFPYGSESGFNRFVDTASLSTGSHTVVVTAFDTAGNTTTHTATVTKATGANPSGFVPPFTEGSPQSVPDGGTPNTPIGDSPKAPRLTVRLSGSALSLNATKNGNCPTLRLVVADTQAKLSGAPTVLATTSENAIRGRAANLSRLAARVKNPKVFFGADCGSGTRLVSRSINPARIASRRTVKNLTAVVRQIAARYKAAK